MPKQETILPLEETFDEAVRKVVQSKPWTRRKKPVKIKSGQSDSPTVRQSDSPTVRQSDSPTVRQSDSPTVRQSDSPTGSREA